MSRVGPLNRPWTYWLKPDGGVDEERIALAFHVPYWVIGGRPRPPWLRRPIWRLRALKWRWFE